jgi:hypothetical protein
LSRYKRKKKSKFLMIEGYILRSPAWRALSPNDRAAYLELKWRYDGLNNGRIGLGCRELAEALGTSKMTALRALDSLMEKGFLAKAKASGFNVKHRAATEWRLTEYTCDVTGELPTKEFMRWGADEKNTVSPEGHTVSPEGQSAPGNGRKTPHGPRGDTVKPISKAQQYHQKDTYSITMGGRADASR